MAKQLPTIDMILDTSSDDESSSDEIFFSPITQPKLISTKKCTDTDCYFCYILKSNCTGKDISIFKNSSKK